MGKDYQQLLYSSSDSLEDINIVDEDDGHVEETSHVLNSSNVMGGNSTGSGSLFDKLKSNLNNMFKSNDNEEEEVESIDSGSHQDGDSNESDNINNQSQISLYSINSTLPWTLRNEGNDSLFLSPTTTTDTIPFSSTNPNYDYITHAILNDMNGNEGTNSTMRTTTTTTTSNIRPPTRTLLSHRQLNENQSNLMKNRDIILIQQPDNKLSIGFNIDKFSDFNKNGEHNINGYYSNYLDNNDILLQRLALLQDSENNENGGVSQYNYIDAYNSENGYGYIIEIQKRQRLFMTLSMVEIFYYILILTSIREVSFFLGYLLFSIVNNLLGIWSIMNTIKRKLFTLYIFFQVLLLISTYFQKVTAFILLKFIIFVIACRVRQDFNLVL